MITKPPYNKTAVESQDVTFPCKGEARPGNLTTRWYKDGVSVKAVDGLSKRTHISGQDGTLTISGVLAEDEGKYTCEITNGMGKPVTAFAHLTVECKSLWFFREKKQTNVLSSICFKIPSQTLHVWSTRRQPSTFRAGCPE